MPTPDAPQLVQLQEIASTHFNIVRTSGPLVIPTATICGRPVDTSRYAAGANNPISSQYDYIMKVTGACGGGGARRRRRVGRARLPTMLWRASGWPTAGSVAGSLRVARRRAAR